MTILHTAIVSFSYSHSRFLLYFSSASSTISWCRALSRQSWLIWCVCVCLCCWPLSQPFAIRSLNTLIRYSTNTEVYGTHIFFCAVQYFTSFPLVCFVLVYHRRRGRLFRLFSFFSVFFFTYFQIPFFWWVMKCVLVILFRLCVVCCVSAAHAYGLLQPIL